MLVLGTAQLGMKYGVANSTGKPCEKDAFHMLEYCVNNGISCFDTAAAYGNSEQILGDFKRKMKQNKEWEWKGDTSFTIITKVHSLQEYERSLDQLGQNLAGVLIHSFNDYQQNPQFVDQLLIRAEKNNIRVGVSVYSVQEAIRILKDDRMDIIQIPFNYLDRQWNSVEFLNLVQQRKGNAQKDFYIYVRSVLLQGKLVKLDLLPCEIREQIYSLCSSLGLNPIELALSYVKTIGWIDGVILGADNLDQIKENVELYNDKCISFSEDMVKRFDIFDQLWEDLKEVIDPRKW